MQQEVAKALRQPDARERFDALAMDVYISTPEEFSAFIAKQVETWTTVARKANLRAA